MVLHRLDRVGTALNPRLAANQLALRLQPLNSREHLPSAKLIAGDCHSLHPAFTRQHGDQCGREAAEADQISPGVQSKGGHEEGQRRGHEKVPST